MTQDIDDLIARLDACNPPDRTIDEQRPVAVMIHEAAAALREQRDEIARLRAENAFLHKRRGEVVIDRDRYRAALGKLPEGRDVMLAAMLAELAKWQELHRVIAEELGADKETWPDHRNAPLAIAATFMLHKQAAERAERAETERDALAAAMPSEGADAALAYAAMKTERDAAMKERDALRNRAWQCGQCGQINNGWADTCGRCDAAAMKGKP